MSGPHDLRVEEASYTSMNSFTRRLASGRKNRFVILKFQQTGTC
jgi:hypothetical protein